MNHHALLIEKTKSVEMGKDTYEKVLFKVNFSSCFYFASFLDSAFFYGKNRLLAL